MGDASLAPAALDAALPTTSLDVVAQSRAVLAKHARSFRFASLFLPRQAADEAAILYAFCREVDDDVDEAGSIEEARRAGARLEAELSGTAPARTSVASFLELAKARRIDVGYARDLVAGARSDAEGMVRVADDEELIRYCYRVAGTVGGMMCPVIGVMDGRAVPFAVDLGIGMQITNICRDVLEDAKNDRCYLPATRLRAAGIEPTRVVDDIVAGTVDRRALARVVADLLAFADRYYASGDAGMRYIPARARAAILVASRVYRAIGVRLMNLHGGDALHGRTMVPLTGKLGWAFRAFSSMVSLAFSPPRARDATLPSP